jgi:hypothetical protein
VGVGGGEGGRYASPGSQLCHMALYNKTDNSSRVKWLF